MEPVTLKQNDEGILVARLQCALIGLGYLQRDWEELENGKAKFDPATQAAIDQFREAASWNKTGRASPSVQYELARQVGALQSKLATLGCYGANQAYEREVYDELTRAAVDRFREKHQSAAKALVEKIPFLAQARKLSELDEGQWLLEYHKTEFDDIRNALVQLDFPGKPSQDESSKAALRFYQFLRTFTDTQLPGVCGPAMLQFLRNTPPYTFDDVLHHELAAIEKGRERIGQSFGVTSSEHAHPLGRAHEARLMGLAFSGGGIRSATFNLGVLQALARVGLLKRFDYLSSVSGGGYISGWLHAWVCRETSTDNTPGILNVERHLASVPQSGRDGCSDDNHAPGSATGSAANEPGPVAWLRRYSNYLTPRLGLLGADTMAAVATWLRNVLLNQTMLLLVVSAVLFLPWLLAWLVQEVNTGQEPWYATAFLLGGVGLGTAASLAAVITSTQDPCNVPILRSIGSVVLKFTSAIATLTTSSRERSEFGAERTRHVGSSRATVVLLCLACVCIGFTLSNTMASLGELYTGLTAFAVYSVPSLVFLFFGTISQEALECKALERRTTIKRNMLRVFAGLLGGVLFGFLLVRLASALPEDYTREGSLLLTAIVAPPAVLGTLLLAVTLHIGLSGRALRESAREWWSRIAGVVTRSGLLWLGLTGVALYGAYGVMYTYDWIVALGGLAWVSTTVAGIATGRSVKANGSGSRWRRLLTRIAPYVFVAGLVVLVSTGLHSTLVWAAGTFTDFAVPAVCESQVDLPQYELSLTLDGSGESTIAEGVLDQPSATTRCDVNRYVVQAYGAVTRVSSAVDEIPEIVMLLGLPLMALVIAFTLGRTVDVNVFAFHMFYRNRLERCYLGASAKNRQADPYTDLDRKDSPRLDALTLSDSEHGQRPYPLINTTLNLTRATNLAWQERKAASFAFTPQYCGYQLPGVGSEGAGAYQKSSDYVKDIGGWMPLGSPITISGAAASPNSGYHTNPAMAALMTVFNVRLGMWIQNPRQSKTWRNPGPRQSLYYLLKELVSTTTDIDDFVYVSDGGHFENLGLYELVRRRCRYVVVCDAGCDRDYTFEDLGNAIRKCKVDLGIDIEIDTHAITPDAETELSHAHCAVGVIHYERVDNTRAVAPGYLLYVKASCVGNEPADVRQYQAQHPSFPHESTGDQWYSESQFESYRSLGFHIMTTLLKDAIGDERRERQRRNARLGDTMHRILGSQRTTIGTGAATGRQRQIDALDREVLFKRLAELWYQSDAQPARSGKHDQMLQKLMTAMGRDPQLRFLDTQIYPEWAYMAQHVRYGVPSAVRSMFPLTHKELRAGFYFCTQLIQFMNEVYQERELERDYCHPDNRGWMNLFHHWSGSGMFRATWAVSASTYGARFQQFCGRHFGLDMGRVQLGRRLPVSGAKQAGGFLTFEEREQLHELSREYANWNWDAILFIPLEVRVDDPQSNRGESFHFQIGFALIEGHFGVERSQSGLVQDTPDNRRVRYFCIRKHLRKMGLGRRALEGMWREDAELIVDVPTDIACVIDEAEPERLLRLWHSVLAAVPHTQIKMAHDLLDDVELTVDLAIKDSVGLESDSAMIARISGEIRKTLPEPDDYRLHSAHLLYLQALEQQSDNDEAWRGIARIKAYRKEFKDAFEILDEMVRRDPNSGLAYYNRAALKMRVSQRKESEVLKDLVKAIELDWSLKGLATKDEDFSDIRENLDFVRLTT